MKEGQAAWRSVSEWKQFVFTPKNPAGDRLESLCVVSTRPDGAWTRPFLLSGPGVGQLFDRWGHSGVLQWWMECFGEPTINHGMCRKHVDLMSTENEPKQSATKSVSLEPPGGQLFIAMTLKTQRFYDLLTIKHHFSKFVAGRIKKL